MPETLLTSLHIMAAFYIVAGISHFIIPKFFIKFTPSWVPSPGKVNILVGIIEVSLGIALLFEETRSVAAIGVIALLIAVFPAHLKYHQMVKGKRKYLAVSLLRMPMQLVLIYWAYTFV
ncbi:MAG: DoxX family protein [Bacteroidota bacterium]